MVGFLTRFRSSSVARRPSRFRPGLELLEARYCPWGGPAINGFAATVLSGQSVRLNGNVSDPALSTVTVSFTGVMSGSTSVDSSGNFSYTANATGLGTVSAVATDGQQLQSATVQIQVVCPKPSLNLTLLYLNQNKLLLTGTVTAPSRGGLTVTFAGVATGSTVTDANGNFSATVSASGTGNINATVTDAWGQVSNPATVAVDSNPPVISNFGGGNVATNQWTFSGTVTDDSPAGITVQLGGIPALTGQTATTASNGTFSITVTLQPHESGTVWAKCTNWFGVTSNTVYDGVVN
jgi:hypothetical protein